MQGIRGDSGFSLMETLVATFILALVSAAGVMLLSGYQEGRLVMKKADERLAELEIARSILRDDLLSTIQRRVRDEYGSRPSGFQGGTLLDESKVLRLVRGGNQGAMISGDISALDRVEYLFEDGTLTRRRYERADITLETNFTERPLLTGLEEIELRFDANGTWIADWGLQGELGELPRLLELTAHYAGGRSLSMTFMVGARS